MLRTVPREKAAALLEISGIPEPSGASVRLNSIQISKLALASQVLFSSSSGIEIRKSQLFKEDCNGKN
jgi:hypothetical protein